MLPPGGPPGHGGEVAAAGGEHDAEERAGRVPPGPASVRPGKPSPRLHVLVLVVVLFVISSHRGRL